MKAIVHTKYGSPNVLRFEEVQKPIPGDDEVLIKIHAASITAGDVIVLKGEPFVTRLVTGLLEPKNKIPGKEMVGSVEAVGGNVTQFQPGDEVYGDLSVASWGAFAEFVSVPVSAIAMKPSNLTFEEAAAVPESALVALQALRDEGKIQPGQKVLVSGSIDPWTPVHLAEEFLTSLSNGQHVVFSESGHGEMLSRQPEASEKLLTTFFKTGTGDASSFTYQPWEYNPGLGFPAITKIVAVIIVLLFVVLIYVVRFFLKKQFGRRYLTKKNRNLINGSTS